MSSFVRSNVEVKDFIVTFGSVTVISLRGRVIYIVEVRILNMSNDYFPINVVISVNQLNTDIDHGSNVMLISYRH